MKYISRGVIIITWSRSQKGFVKKTCSNHSNSSSSRSSRVAGPGSSRRKITDVLWKLDDAIKYMSLDDAETHTFHELIASLRNQNHLLIVPGSLDDEDGYITRTAETLRIIGHPYEYWHKGRPGVDAIRWEIVPKQIPRRNILPADDSNFDRCGIE